MKAKAAGLLVLILTGTSAATTIHVPGDHPTIQAGIDAAAPGDTVQVECGTYLEHGIILKGGIVVRSATGDADCVTVDGQQMGSVIAAGGFVDPTVVEGFTITGGHAGIGGGLYVSAAALTLRHCDILHNTAGVSGGGVVSLNSTIELEMCTIARNVAVQDRGGGFRIRDSFVSLVGCDVVWNSSGLQAGGIYYGHSHLTIERSILAFNAGGQLSQYASTLDASCTDSYPGALPGADNFSADPLFCDAVLDDYTLQSGSPCLPDASPCGELVGSRTHGCGPVDDVSVIVTTAPPGLPVVVDGARQASPAAFVWPQFSIHKIAADSLVAIGGVGGQTTEREVFLGWDDGGAIGHEIVVPAVSAIYTASFQRQFLLSTRSGAGGTVTPPTGWHDEGASVSITAIAEPTLHFEAWTGSGSGSYTGEDNPAVVTMLGPVTETASFEPIGYEFSLSASDTDPFLNEAPPAGSLRSVHLWLVCSDGGLSAFEAEASGSLVPLAFAPANGVLNAGNATYLLLAVPDCPEGEDVQLRLGSFLVQDDGGDLCLAPSQAHGILGAVDCAPAFQLTVDPGVTGFSSSGTPPCRQGIHGCPSGGLIATSAPPGRRPPGRERSTELLPARPNPFEATTTLEFRLAAPGPVVVSVFDVAGRLVRPLVRRPLPAGVHRVTWDGRDATGGDTPAGVYFYRLETSGGDQVRKLIRLRP